MSNAIKLSEDTVRKSCQHLVDAGIAKWTDTGSIKLDLSIPTEERQARLRAHLEKVNARI